VNLTPADACDAVLAKYGDLRGGRYAASPVDETSLMLVVGQDDHENPFVGGGWLVGPDRQVWTVSSNSGIRDVVAEAAAGQLGMPKPRQLP
jgi:hypothetical protein